MQTQQTYVSEKLRNTSNVVINPATEEKQDSLLTELQLKADLTDTQPVSVASIPLPTGASTEATQVEVKDFLSILADITLSDDKVHLLLQQIRDSIRMPINYNEATNTTNINGSVVVS